MSDVEVDTGSMKEKEGMGELYGRLTSGGMATLSSKLSIYLRSSGASLASTILSKASGFASVWLLNRILAKGGYGNYEFAFTIVSLLLLVGAGGLNHAVMYRLSRLDSPPEKLDGHDFAGAALGWSLLLSTLFAGLVFWGAPFVEALAGNEDLAFWVSLLAFLIPIGAARGIYQSWHEARQRIPESIFMGKVLPAIARVILLSAVWLLWPTAELVIAAVLLSELGPLLGWYVRTPVNPFRLRGQLSSWDVWYSVKLAITQGFSRTTQRTDILMVGVLATAEATAEYAVASKLALLLAMSHNILNSILRPRIGRFLSKQAWTALKREYDQTRTVALISALIGATVFAFSGKWLLGVFGDYQASYPILMILAGAHIANVSFGMCGGYLGIAGYAGWTLAVSAMNLSLNIAANFLLIPVIGAVGAAVATLLSMMVGNIVVAFIAAQADGFHLYSVEVAVIAVAALAVTGLGAIGVLQPHSTGILLFCTASIFTFLKFDQLQPILYSFFRLVVVKQK